MAAIGAAAPGAVAGAGAVRELALADGAQEEGFVLDAVGDDVDDVAFLLDLTDDTDHRRRQDDAPELLVEALPDDDVGDAALVLDRDEGDIAGAGPLADEDDAGEADPAAVPDPLQRRAGDRAALLELRPDEGERMVGMVTELDAQMDEVCLFLERERIRVPGFNFMRNTIYLRFCHEAYSKGTALGELARLTGIPREEIFAAGDHYNDLPMLDGRFAQWVACSGNAVASVKAAVTEAGGYVAKGECSAGIVEALHHFGAREELRAAS